MIHVVYTQRVYTTHRARRSLSGASSGPGQQQAVVATVLLTDRKDKGQRIGKAIKGKALQEGAGPWGSERKRLTS